jgi:heavy metal sensor kinase
LCARRGAGTTRGTRLNPRSLPFRLGVWYTLLLSATFVLVATGTFYGLQQYLRAGARDSLTRHTAEVEQILSQSTPDAADRSIAREIELRLAPEINNRFVRVTRVPGRLLYLSGPPADGSFNRLAVSTGVADAATKLSSEFTTRLLADQHLMLGIKLLGTVSGRYIIEMGISIAPMETVLARLVDLLAVLLPVLIVFAAVGGYWLVRWALRPVDRLSQTAEQMSMQNLSLQLPVAPTGDALERLSISLNTMLRRLRDSVQTSRRFLADASHELRTPLTVIKGELQELIGESSLSERDLRERLGSVLEEVARLEHLVSGLLVLSRLDAGETRGNWVEVDLADLALSIAEQMHLMAEDRGIEIDVSGLQRTVVLGDRARLKQVIVNLLDNAIRFTPRQGVVTLRTGTDRTGRFLEVADTGIGIPPASIPQVFERFFRVDEARPREDGGAGLGLSIVRSICSVHSAEIEVESRLGSGSCFRVRFSRRMSGAATALEILESGGSAEPEMGSAGASIAGLPSGRPMTPKS